MYGQAYTASVNADPASTDPNDIMQLYDTYYNEAYSCWNVFYPLAERDLRFYLGDQWDEKEKRDLYNEGRSTFVFNRIRRNIDMVSGYQRKHRMASIVAPVEQKDEAAADQASKLLLHINHYSNTYEIISDCFGGALKTGMNLASLWMDYRDDPVDGDFRISREPYNGFIVDPYFTKQDLSDCGYIMRRRYLNLQEAQSLVPQHKDQVQELYTMGWDRDDKFSWMAYQRQPGGQPMIAYDELWQQLWKTIPVVVEMDTGRIIDPSKSDVEITESQLKEFASRYKELEVVYRPKRYVRRDIIVNRNYIRSDINPYGLDEYPFALSLAVFAPESDQWGLKTQSLIRCQIDPQREGNRRRSQMVDMVDSQLNSGWIADEDAVKNPRSLYQTAQGKVIWRKVTDRQNTIEKIPPAQIPPSMFELQKLFDQDIVDIPGINDASFGQADSSVETGIMMMLRQSAAIINLQDIFDRLRFFQKEIARKQLKMIQKSTPEKLERILGEPPAPELFDPNLTKFDITVREGLLTDTQQQMYFRNLVELRQIGVQGITDDMLLDASPIQPKTEMRKKLQEQQQQAQKAAEEQRQIEMQKLQAELIESQSRSLHLQASSGERTTRAVANMGLEDERASESVDNRADAAYSRARAAKELSAMDDEKLIKYLEMVKAMEEINEMKERRVKADDVVISTAAQEVSNAGQNETMGS